MTEKIPYREGEIPFGLFKKQHEEGVVHVCAICGSELMVALSDDEIKKYKRGKGIFCPKDLKHVNVKIMPKRKNISF